MMRRKRPNDDIRRYAKQNGVYLWQIAERNMIDDSTLSKYFRHELPQKEKERYYEQIDQIAAQSRSEQ